MTESLQNINMSLDTAIPSEIMARMQDAADKAATGGREPALMLEAITEMNRLREALRRRIGTVEIAVDLIRDARDP